MIPRLTQHAWACFLLGLVMCFCGERIVDAASVTRWIFDSVGILLVALAATLRWRERSLVEAPVRATVTPSAIAYTVALVGLVVCYPFATRDVIEALAISEASRASWEAAWTVLWLIVVGASSTAAFFAEASRARLKRPERVPLERVRSAAAGGLSLSLALAWIMALNYAVTQHDTVWEWGRSTYVRPSNAMQELASGLEEELTLTAFFAPNSDMLQRVHPYLKELGSFSSQLHIEVIDHAVEPRRAGELGALRNGAIFVTRGKAKRRVDLGSVLDRQGRERLTELDRNLQEALLKVGRSRRGVYITVGHGERQDTENADGNPGMNSMRLVLGKLNVTVRNLSSKDGLSNTIPNDARVIFIIGPSSPFLPEEVNALRTWYAAGGSLGLWLEPDSNHGLDDLLQDLNVGLEAGVVANTRYHRRVEGGPSDRVKLLTNRFGTHPSVSALSSASHQVALAFDGAAAVSAETVEGARRHVLVRPMAESWIDRDQDREPSGAQDSEAVQALAVATAQTLTDGTERRALLVGDADVLSDKVMGQPANLRFLVDSYLWLAREDDTKLRVTQADKEPMILHSRGASAVWFWLTIAGVPILTLALGLRLVARRRRRGSV